MHTTLHFHNDWLIYILRGVNQSIHGGSANIAVGIGGRIEEGANRTADLVVIREVVHVLLLDLHLLLRFLLGLFHYWLWRRLCVCVAVETEERLEVLNAFSNGEGVVHFAEGIVWIGLLVVVFLFTLASDKPQLAWQAGIRVSADYQSHQLVCLCVVDHFDQVKIVLQLPSSLDVDVDRNYFFNKLKRGALCLLYHLLLFWLFLRSFLLGWVWVLIE